MHTTIYGVAPASARALAMPNMHHAAPTLLGNGPVRIPVGGRIRAGIKMLTRRAAENAAAQAIYARGIAEGRGFESIESELKTALPDLKSPLVPRNVPYFTVRAEDFPNPELARLIMDKFAEDRGEGGKRLYRFPVVFPADAWQNVMPHEMVTWTASERRFWSEYSSDGQTRYCKTHEAVPVDGNGKRSIRVFGGRKTVLRPDNGGVCEPEACPEYQSRKCNLSGRFIFFIPGIPSISAFDLPTNSFYAMQAAIEKFQTIGFMRGGRISGFLDEQHTPFFITKRLVEVSRIDEEGKPSRAAQWLIELEAPIDVTALLRPDDGLELQAARAQHAVALLEGGAHIRAEKQEGDFDNTATSLSVQAQAEINADSSAVEESTPALKPQPLALQTRPSPSPRNGADGRAESAGGKTKPLSVGDGLRWVFDAAQALGVEEARYEQYAKKRWGTGWKQASDGRRSALNELSKFADNADGFRKKVTAEIEVWA